MKMTSFIVFTTTFLLLVANTSAHGNKTSNFSIQIGAYHQVSKALTDSLEQYDNVSTEYANNLTRVLLGKFNSKQEAELLLNRLKEDGYNDAFIRSIGTSSESTNQGHSHGRADRDYTELDLLDPSDKPFAVYLDGKLHLKKGDTFIPVN